MTRVGVGFIVAGVIIYLVASQSQVGWLYLFDAVIWSILIISAVLAHHDLRSLKVEQRVIPPLPGRQSPGGPVEDEVAEVKFRVINGGRLARHFISLKADFPFAPPEQGGKEFLVNSIKPHSAAEFGTDVTCYRRGRYAESEIVLSSGGPLGLFSRRRVFRVSLNLTVYPRYYRMGELKVSGEEWTDWGDGSRAASASQFYGSREYRYGDPLKHIHWRNTARLGEYMIKEFEQSGRGAVTVAFDTSTGYGSGRETTLEYSIRIVASLAKLCADAGRGIDMLAGGTYLHNAGWRESMDYLAGMEVKKNSVPAAFPAGILPGRSAVIISAAGADSAAGLMRLAGQSRGSVLVLLEGFSGQEESGGVVRGSNVITCAPGGLEETVKKLGTLLASAENPSMGASR